MSGAITRHFQQVEGGGDYVASIALSVGDEKDQGIFITWEDNALEMDHPPIMSVILCDFSQCELCMDIINRLAEYKRGNLESPSPLLVAKWLRDLGYEEYVSPFTAADLLDEGDNYSQEDRAVPSFCPICHAIESWETTIERDPGVLVLQCVNGHKREVAMTREENDVLAAWQQAQYANLPSQDD